MSVTNIRTWLRKSPEPVKVQIGRTTIAVPNSRTKWADIVATIEATAEDGDKIVALDAGGVVLRAFVFEASEIEPEDEAAAPAAKGGQTELVALARELNIAADNGAKRHEAAYLMAFERITGLCQTISDRLSAMEAMWSKAMLAQARAQADSIVAAAQARGGDDDPNSVMKLLGPMLGPALANMVEKASPPPNGQKKGNA